MIGMSIHNVASVEVTRLEKNTLKTGKDYAYREIVIKNEEGAKFSISLFADETPALRIKI